MVVGAVGIVGLTVWSWTPGDAASQPGTLTNIASPIVAFALIVCVLRGASRAPKRVPRLLFAELFSSRFAAGVACAVVLLSITAALDGPTRLAEAVVFRDDGRCALGALVAQNADGVVLGDGVAQLHT
jgi:hypothetical protein